jgi:hypothetical protein
MKRAVEINFNVRRKLSLSKMVDASKGWTDRDSTRQPWCGGNRPTPFVRVIHVSFWALTVFWASILKD